MIDPVAVAINDKFGNVVERAYADALGLTVLDDQPVIAHGRLRGMFRLNGRPIKPKVRKGRAIPTTTDTDGTPAVGDDDGRAVETPEEASQ